MSLSSQPPLKCPHCGAPLRPEPAGLLCANNHRFDRARRGYINLLAAHHKRSRSPGDNKDMVRARSGFLARGRYQPLVKALLTQAKNTPDCWLDIGCGEGWYSAQLAEQLGAHQGVGLDISKFAVDAAAKRNKTLTWLVASGARLPVLDHSVQTALVLFAPIFADELARVLAPGGELIVAGTGDNHLRALRETLYENVQPSHFDGASFLDHRLQRQHREELALTWQPEGLEELEQLLAMTPHYWRATAQAKSRLGELVGQPMQAHFVLERWQRRPLND